MLNKIRLWVRKIKTNLLKILDLVLEISYIAIGVCIAGITAMDLRHKPLHHRLFRLFPPVNSYVVTLEAIQKLNDTLCIGPESVGKIDKQYGQGFKLLAKLLKDEYPGRIKGSIDEITLERVSLYGIYGYPKYETVTTLKVKQDKEESVTLKQDWYSSDVIIADLERMAKQRFRDTLSGLLLMFIVVWMCLQWLVIRRLK